MGETATTTPKTFFLWPPDQIPDFYNLALLNENVSKSASSSDPSMEIYYRIHAQNTFAWQPTLREVFLHHGSVHSDAVASARGVTKGTRDLYARQPHYLFRVHKHTGNDMTSMKSLYAGRDFTFSYDIDGKERHFSWKAPSFFGSKSYKLVDPQEPEARMALFTFKKSDKDCGDLTIDVDRGLEFEYLVIITWMSVMEVLRDRQVRNMRLMKMPIEVLIYVWKLLFSVGDGDGGGGGGGD